MTLKYTAEYGESNTIYKPSTAYTEDKRGEVI